MHLLKIIEKGKPFQELLALAQTGDRIYIDDCHDSDGWKPSKDGIIAAISNKLFNMNLDVELHTGTLANWQPFQDGVIVDVVDGSLWFFPPTGEENKKHICQTDGRKWKAGENGIFLDDGHLIHHLNMEGNSEPVYRRVLGDDLTQWKVGPGDSLILEYYDKEKNLLSLVQRSVSGEDKLLYTCDENGYCEAWEPHPAGVVTSAGTDISLSRSPDDEVSIYGDLKDREEFDSFAYAPGLPGILVERKGVIHLLVHKD